MKQGEKSSKHLSVIHLPMGLLFFAPSIWDTMMQWFRGFVLWVYFSSSTLLYSNYNRNACIEIFSFLLTLFPWKTKCSCTPMNGTFYERLLLLLHTFTNLNARLVKKTFHDIFLRNILNAYVCVCSFNPLDNNIITSNRFFYFTFAQSIDKRSHTNKNAHWH